jgi:hypothetical protein
LFFDDLTLDNIKDIIKKSLKSLNKKYGNVSEDDVTTLTDDKLVEFFKEAGMTGAFIHEIVQDIKNKSEILELPLDLDKIVADIKKRNDILDKKLKAATIANKLSGQGKKMGY